MKDPRFAVGGHLLHPDFCNDHCKESRRGLKHHRTVPLCMTKKGKKEVGKQIQGRKENRSQRPCLECSVFGRPGNKDFTPRPIAVLWLLVDDQQIRRGTIATGLCFSHLLRVVT